MTKKAVCPYRRGTFEAFAWTVTQIIPKHIRPTKAQTERSLKMMALENGRSYKDALKKKRKVKNG